jgi:hypothetical protein
MDIIQNEVSGVRAVDMVSRISKYHRIRGGGEGSEYNECVEWLADELEKIGCTEVKVKKFRADGKKKYYSWTSLVGWMVNEAELWLLEPFKQLISRFTDEPASLMTYSQGGEATSEVVYVGQGKTDGDYEEKDVKDKLVFAVGGESSKVYRQAVLERGAAGVIVGPSHRRARLPYTDLIEVGRISPTAHEWDKTRFGFSISRNQQKMLKDLLDSGDKLVMRAFVDAELIVGDMPVLEAKLQGEVYPKQEIIVMGHLDHYKPGANDNASGCAGMVEMIRNILTLIEREDIPPLKRTIRFLFVPEIHGTIAYLSEHEELRDKAIIGLNLDMIGEDLATCQSSFNLTCSPYSVPGYLNDVVSNLLPWLEEDSFISPKGSRYHFNYRIKPYSGGSDHVMFNDSTFSVPSVMFGHDDIFHHTNLDNIEKCDPTEMKRIISLAEATCLLIANAEVDDALRIAEEVYGNACIRMSKKTKQSLQILRGLAIEGEEEKLREYYFMLSTYPEVQRDVESTNLEKLQELSDKSETLITIKAFVENIKSQALREEEKLRKGYELILKQYSIREQPYTPSVNVTRASFLKPRRLFKGPLLNDYDRRMLIWEDIKEKLGEERSSWYEENKAMVGESLNSKVFEFLNLMDGSRTLLGIRNIISCEFNETSVTYLLNFAEDLEKIGLITLSDIHTR